MAVVQAGVGPITSTYPYTYTFPEPVTVGNRIIVLGNHSYSGCPVSATDSLLNAYTKHIGEYTPPGGTAGNGVLEVLSAPITTGGACTVSVAAHCGNSSKHYFFLEVSGLDASPFEVSFTGLGGQTTASVTSGNLTTTAAGDLLIALFLGSASGNRNGSDIQNTNGFTIQTWDASDYILTKTAGAAGTETFTGTAVGTNLTSFPTVAYLVAFKAIPLAPDATSGTLAEWYKSDAGADAGTFLAGAYADGAAMNSGWNDESGAAKNLAKFVGSATYRKNIFGTIGAADFNGNGLDGRTHTTQIQSFIAPIVVPATLGGSQIIDSTGSPGIGPVFRLNSTSGKLTLEIKNYATGAVTTVATLTPGQSYVIGFTLNQATKLASFFINAAWDSTSTINTGGLTFSADDFFFLADGATGTAGAHLKIGEAVFYSTPLQAADIIAVQRWMMSKYGITNAAPGVAATGAGAESESSSATATTTIAATGSDAESESGSATATTSTPGATGVSAETESSVATATTAMPATSAGTISEREFANATGTEHADASSAAGAETESSAAVATTALPASAAGAETESSTAAGAESAVATVTGAESESGAATGTSSTSEATGTETESSTATATTALPATGAGIETEAGAASGHGVQSAISGQGSEAESGAGAAQETVGATIGGGEAQSGTAIGHEALAATGADVESEAATATATTIAEPAAPTTYRGPAPGGSRGLFRDVDFGIAPFR